MLAGSDLGASSPALEALVETALLTSIIVLIHFAWLLAGASLSRILRHRLASRLVNVTLAGILVITSVIALLPR